MKAKKIKIIIASVLLAVVLIASTLLTMTFNKKSYMMSINRPDSIIVYHNDASKNIVFVPQDKEYNKIYSLITDGCKKSVLSAIINNEISKDVYIEEVDASEIKFNTIIINFCYNKPQIAQLKNKDYLIDGQNYWYQNLIFTLSNDSQFKYSSVAIIVPENDLNFVGPFNYTLSYKVYSNWSKCYNFSSNLF